MARYTMELREYIEQASGYEPLSTRDRIEKGRSKLFDFDYTLFDSTYKKVFETHFIRHFYMREIGFETEGLFKFQLETWLLIHMPYYNKLFESELLKYDPLINQDLKETRSNTKNKTQQDTRDLTSTGQTDGSANATGSQSTQQDSSHDQHTTGTGSENNFDRHLESTTPDNRLAITTEDGAGVIEYASRIEENTVNNKKDSAANVSGSAYTDTTDTTTNDTTASSTSSTTANDKLASSINETDDFVLSRSGKTGDKSTSQLLTEYRDSLLRIEQSIFKEMQELFMLVY